MSRQPLVTVVMAVHNNVDFIDEAVTSLLRQSWAYLEILIVLDAPTDGTDEAVAKFDDPRIRVIRNETNLGQTASLRRGLQEAKGDYIARLDGDDIASPERIEKQVNFLEKHTNVGLLGCACQVIDEKGRPVESQHWPEKDLEIRWTSLLENPFGHPTVMLRRNVLERHQFNYDEVFESAQDYDLWTRMMASTYTANLQEQLVSYRIHSGSITAKKRETQLRNHDAIALRTIKNQLPEYQLSLSELSDMREVFVGGIGRAKSFARGYRIELANRYLDMLDLFVAKSPFDSSARNLKRQVATHVARVWWSTIFGNGWLRLTKRLFVLVAGH